MKRTLGTTALMRLEDLAPDALFETLPNSDLHVWPLLRWLVARSMAELELGVMAVAAPFSLTTAAIRAARQLPPHRFKSRAIRGQADLVFVVSGNTLGQREDGRHNWLVDDFAEDFEQSAIVLQDGSLDAFVSRSQKPLFPRTFSFADSTVRIEAAARLSRPAPRDISHVRDVVREVYRHLEFDVPEARIRATEQQLLFRTHRAQYSVKHFQRVLDKLKPRAVFMQGAAYGDRAPYIRLLKSRGIHVAEHQHGWIGASHGAYNYGAAAARPELAQYLPDTLLTFGDYWSESVDFPGTTVAIGKPHLEAQARNLPALGSRPRTVMVVSSVADRVELSTLTLRLRDMLPGDWALSFRPHPSERAQVRNLYPMLDHQARVSFDLGSDVYESLRRSRGVVGLASTVMFEALAFGCPVAVKDSALADFYGDESFFGECISDDASLQRAVDRLISGDEMTSRQRAAATRESVWKPDAVANFRRFVETLA